MVSYVVSHPLVLFYAQSGAGKTSLLNARVIPVLGEERGAEVFEVSRVSGKIPKGVSIADVPNIFVLNVLLSLEASGKIDPKDLAGQSLKDYLRMRRSTDIVQTRFRVLVIDQFEELFTYRQDRWMDRAAFFEDIADALEDDKHLRVVLAMREEFVAALDPYKMQLPEWGRTRYRLERLGPAYALDAIVKPAERFGRHFAPGAAEKQVAKLLSSRTPEGNEASDEYVEPLQLQVVCHQLWRALPDEVREIDEKYILNYGDVDEALAAYYEQCVQEVVRDGTVTEGKLRRWIEDKLITPAGTRGLVYMGGDQTEGLNNQSVEVLARTYLIRSEHRSGATWYELSHDRFIRPICLANDRWRALQGESEIAARQLEDLAKKWERDGKPKEMLLTGANLVTAREWAQKHGDESGLSSQLSRFLASSDSATLRRRGLILGLLGLFGVLLFGGIAYSLSKRVEAEKKQRLEIARVLESELLKIAEQYFNSPEGREFDVLALGIKAASVRIKQGEEPSPSTRELLRATVKSIGFDTWLLPYKGAQGLPIFSKDGKYLVTQRADAYDAWDASTGAYMRSTKRDTTTAPRARSRAGFLDARRVLLQAGSDVRIWNVETDEEPVVLGDSDLDLLDDLGPALQISHDGNYMAATNQGRFRLDSTPEDDWGTRIYSLKSYKKILYVEHGRTILFSKAGALAYLAIDDENRTEIEKIDLETVARTPTGIRIPKDAFGRLTLSADGMWLGRVNGQGSGEILDLQTHKLVARLPDLSTKGRLWTAVLSRDGKVFVRSQRLVSQSDEVNVAVFDREQKKGSSMKVGGTIQDVVLSDDGRGMAILARARDGTYTLSRYDLTLDNAEGPWTPKLIETVPTPPVRAVSAEKNWRVWVREQKALAVNTDSGRKRTQSLPVTAVAAAAGPDARTLAYVDEKTRTRIRDMDSAVVDPDVSTDSRLIDVACRLLRKSPLQKDALTECPGSSQ